MKKILLLIVLSSSVVFGQNTVTLTKAAYQQLKQSGAIDPNIRYSFSDQAFPSSIKYAGSVEKTGMCDCMVPLDSTFQLAMLPNDDESSAVIGLPFSFDFYGVQYDSLYINNNGNISFVAPYYTFTPNSFPDATYNMIAPFWGDVDTRGSYDSLGNLTGLGGHVWYKVTPTALIVNWDHVGYFAYHTDLQSTFQLIISNGSDPLIAAGGNVSFCYQDMQWTTGDASMGAGGFGGAAATVGVNIGNGTDYFQVGQFDQAGTAFDGPVNLNDGVDFLDGQEIYFNVAGATSTNTPPLLISSTICDTIDVYTGDTLVKSNNTADFSFGIMTPENNQTIQTSYTTNAPAGAFSYTTQSIGNEFYKIDASFNATGVAPGVYTIDFTATDNGIPVGVTTQQFVVKVTYEASAGIAETTADLFALYPNPTDGIFQLKVKESMKNVQVMIRDLSGKILLEQPVAGNQTIDLTAFNSGMYLVTLMADQHVLGVQRVVKN